MDELPTYAYYSSPPHEVTAAVNRRQAIYEEVFLTRDPQGKRILTLRQEKDQLLDTVWLASSSKQIKELWQSVTQLLKEEPTELQTQALHFEPVESD